MSAAAVGSLLGAALGCGLLALIAHGVGRRSGQLQHRVAPYLRDLDAEGASPGHGWRGRSLGLAAAQVDRILGGAASVRRRLDRAAIEGSVTDFRVEQVQWALICFALAAGYSVLSSGADAGAWVSALFVCGAAFAAGPIARDWWLTQQVQRRERQILAEFPAVAELLALSVAAGETAVSAIDRVVTRSAGALSHELSGVLGQIRTGVTVSAAFDQLASRTGLPVVARFAQAVATAIERGTPLADVLHAQAADVREAGRRELIEVAARKEIAMLVPVVFLILPLTVLFAFWPGLVGLHLSAT